MFRLRYSAPPMDRLGTHDLAYVALLSSDACEKTVHDLRVGEATVAARGIREIITPSVGHPCAATIATKRA